MHNFFVPTRSGVSCASNCIQDEPAENLYMSILRLPRETEYFCGTCVRILEEGGSENWKADLPSTRIRNIWVVNNALTPPGREHRTMCIVFTWHEQIFSKT